MEYCSLDFLIRENEFQIKWDFILNLLISLIIFKNNLKLQKYIQWL